MVDADVVGPGVVELADPELDELEVAQVVAAGLESVDEDCY